VGDAVAREWLDASGKNRLEANLVTIKDGKVYLEKSSGEVIPVPLVKLSRKDQEYLVGLPEYREYFAKNPLPGVAAGKASGETGKGETGKGETGKGMVQITVPDESIVGEVRRFPELGWGVRSLAFSPDGALLAVGKMDDTVVIFDVNEQARVSLHPKLEGLGQVTAVAFSPDGTKLLTGGYRGRIQIWNVKPTGQLTEANRFVGHSAEVTAITVSSDGQYVLSADVRGAQYWKLDTGVASFQVTGFGSKVGDTCLPPGSEKGFVSDGSVVKIVNLKSGEVESENRMTAVASDGTVAFSPDASRVIARDTYALQMLGVANGREYPPLQEREIQWTAVFSPDGKYVISGGSQKVNVWDVSTSQKILEFDCEGAGYVQSVAYSPDRRHIAAVGGAAGQTLRVFRLPSQMAQ
jgi:WD40 repeat protein